MSCNKVTTRFYVRQRSITQTLPWLQFIFPCHNEVWSGELCAPAIKNHAFHKSFHKSTTFFQMLKGILSVVLFDMLFPVHITTTSICLALDRVGSNSFDYFPASQQYICIAVLLLNLRHKDPQRGPGKVFQWKSITNNQRLFVYLWVSKRKNAFLVFNIYVSSSQLCWLCTLEIYLLIIRNWKSYTTEKINYQNYQSQFI